jgi:hypothetical protein
MLLPVADKVSVAEFVKLALDLTNEELRQAVEFLNREYRNRISRAAREAAAALRPGDWVEVTQGSRKLPAGLRGHVVEVRREQVDVHFPEHGSGYWTLTALLVRKVEGPRH